MKRLLLAALAFALAGTPSVCITTVIEELRQLRI
jgi:hypothetical protein